MSAKNPNNKESAAIQHATTITINHVHAMLMRLDWENDKTAPDAAAAIKHWLPGQDEKGRLMLLEFVNPGEEQEAEWGNWWKTVTASLEAALRVRETALKCGYTDAVVEAVREQKERQADELCVADYVQILRNKLPPVRSVHGKFFVYREGVWKEESLSSMEALGQSVLAHKDRNSRMAALVVSSLANEVLWRGELNSAACFGEGRKSVLLCCPSGVAKVTAEGVEMLPHSPDYNFQHMLKADYKPGAQCPLFEDAVDVALPGEADGKGNMTYADRDKLFWVGGWMIYPANPFKIVVVPYGRGDTRKTTIVDNGLGSIFDESDGTRKAITMAEICDKKRYALPHLVKAMVNFSGELNTLEVEDSSVFKTLAAGEPLEVRQIGQDMYPVANYATKLVFMANSLPQFRHGGDAEYNRLEFLAFLNPVARAAVDKSYRDRVKLEQDGILTRWMIPALQGILRGVPIPAGSKASQSLKEMFGHANDPFSSFALQRLNMDPEMNRMDQLEREDAERAMMAYCEDYGLSEKLVPSVWAQLQKKCGLELYRPWIKDTRSGKKRFQPAVLRGASLKPETRLAVWRPDDGRRKYCRDID